MTLEEVQLRVEDIRKMVDDDEVAHGAEDMLHQELLRAIADGRCSDPAACALAALETQEIDFRRECG